MSGYDEVDQPNRLPNDPKDSIFSNHSEKHPIQSLCLSTRRMYNTMQYSNEKTTDYLVSFPNDQKVKEACNWSLITRDVQEHGIKILFPLHNTGFDSLKDEKKEAENSGEEMLCAILYLEKSDKARFADLKKRV